MGKGRVKRVFRAMIGLMLAGVLLMIGLMLAGVLLLFTPKLILWSDRLSPGDRVIVMDGRWVVLDGHIPGATRESVSSGTRATVLSDDEPHQDSWPDEWRNIRILLLDGPYRGLKGETQRESLRRRF